ncbi:MAG: cation-transporting P-type ATPase, partial [Clostridia bacterium]|nr:cation-transporting P-type ATPase [Clostridia bacterium]
MPSPEQKRDRKVRRKINPATASVEELVSHLATDPAGGLSPKEAERRLHASTAAPLYRLPTRRFWDCVKQTVMEPALWLLLTVSLISLFFDRVPLGLVCLLMGVGNVLLSAYFLYRSAAINAAFTAYDAPLCRVLRGRRIHRIGAAELVKGDIVLFYPGDMIPADCRLLRTDGFVVSEREIDARDADRPLIRLDKDASSLPDATGNYRLSPSNMVFAGGVAEEGFAIAVVISVGSETHLGGLTGGLTSPRAGKNPPLHNKVSRALSVWNLLLLLLVLPVTAIGIFTLGENYDLLDIFLSGVAVASVTLTEQILAKSTYLYAILRRKAATERDTANSADVRSAADAERLTRVTDLILVGTSALHDGESHAEALLVGDRSYRCDRPEADDAAKAVADLFYIYRHGLTAYPSVGGQVSVPADTLLFLADAVSDWAEIDTDALLLRAKDIRSEGDGISAVLPTTAGNHRVTIRLTADFDDVKTCNMRCSNGLLLPMSESFANDMYRAYREAIRMGRHALFLITRAGNETAVRCMLTYAPHTSRKTAGTVKSLEAAGVRVSLFLKDASEASLRAAEECGLTESATAVSATETIGSPVALLDEGRRVFTGCRVPYIENCI